ncbi:MAG: MarR family winged helix-turn-helix transcriptional regulator [Verrucomicrobia bacterium]|nr:MarR family winged helix-turn-helix transcriptional regulator [Verrucomicrobiota bacterium]
MEQTHDKNPQPALECAVEFLEVLPLLMGSLQCELRHDPATTLTMVQFRTLAFLSRRGIASVSEIADFLGLGLPATSKIIDGLVCSKAISRRGDPVDRRRVLLEISHSGRSELLATRAITHNHLAELLSPLSEIDRTRLLEALRTLRPIFAKFNPGECPSAS